MDLDSRAMQETKCQWRAKMKQDSNSINNEILIKSLKENSNYENDKNSNQ